MNKEEEQIIGAFLTEFHAMHQRMKHYVQQNELWHTLDKNDQVFMNELALAINKWIISEKESKK